MNVAKLSREELARRVFDAIKGVCIAEAKSERRAANPWFSMKARGCPAAAQGSKQAA